MRTRDHGVRGGYLDGSAGEVHIVIMGCGRVGSTLAHTLVDLGHTVAVIDRDPEAFRRLRGSVAKHAVRGQGHDREVLLAAGIDRAGAFAAVSNGDNSNIISARVAREAFGVDNVVARIYDPRRAEVYQRLGIPTVATVRWTADAVLRRMVPGDGRLTAGPEWQDASGTLAMNEMNLPRGWAGRRVADLEERAPVRVVYLTRAGRILLAGSGELLEEGDVLHVVARGRDLDGLRLDDDETERG
ncbi:Trk system potassium uptake protein trkA [Nocardiopsis dassonvillei]|uniref:Trk system potassium uptake protein TrkA n=1 Tax=Nocardiopsis dassonvillei (strain ATCC 23218 / DSM 43111 / CIP 107115 / JCM 7437 / KCTC 9190 / NBRC 14626 / NCTC 10488 / NRRL B-5397 / IMRU 509) TaxID=446468 RepID=D7B0Q0_NOCDD|nr:TrkA-N domain protein [Nocardiopsis dassonvillei subsp. dassonvillei DSM 43111]VEI88788.1 Trk system potassium uptake protein trkA [Nocardiopsis dassonvillei]